MLSQPSRAFSFAALVACSSLSAQLQWKRVDTLNARSGHAMAFDAIREVSVLFGGASGYTGLVPSLGDTWELDATGWKLRQVQVAPPARSQHAMAYDLNRRRTVLFGGVSQRANGRLYRGDVWEWDGARWHRITNLGPKPTARTGHAMAYDIARGRVVMFGGQNATGQALNETWEWNGQRWTQQMPTTHPPRLTEHSLVYDAVRNRSIVFGGFERDANQRPIGDSQAVWEWDGTNWRRRSAANAPRARAGHAAVYDLARREMVVHGGIRVPGDEVHTWNGTAWTTRTLTTSPKDRYQHAMAYDSARQRTVLFGHHTQQESDTWEWNGTQWTEREAKATIPQLGQIALAYDDERAELVAFGGRTSQGLSAETWVFDGKRWVERKPATSPRARYGASMVYDPVRSRVVMFGGRDFLPNNETWEWNGNDWTRASTSAAPAARSGARMAFDPIRNRVVLWGGQDRSNAPLRDTWEWDGLRWIPSSGGPQPTAKLMSMAFDEARSTMVLAGWGETWVRRGTLWAKLPVPAPTRGGSLVYDRARTRVVMVPDFGLGGAYDWDGRSWTQRATNELLHSTHDRALAYDSDKRAILMVAGLSNAGKPTSDIYQLGAINPASARRYGRGCLGSAGVPSLVADSLPWIADSHDLLLTGLRNRAPVAMVVGGSNQRWGTINLPFDLGPIGMPGCSLLTRPDVVLGATPSGRDLRLTITLCDCRELIGRHYYSQAAMVSPNSNALGIVMSNAVDGTVGSR